MLRLLNTKDDLLPGAILYLRVYFLGMPALALYNFGNAVFSAIGDTKKPLMYLSIAGALNIALNLFFVIVCQLSVVGVALASAISQCVSAGLILRALTRVQDCYVLDVHKAAPGPCHNQEHSGPWSACRIPECHFCHCKPVHSGRRQLLRLPHGQGQQRRRQRRRHDLRLHGRILHGLCKLYEPELRRRQAGPREEELLHQSGLLLWCGPDPGREPVLLRPHLPCPVHHRERRHRRRHEARGA